MADLLNSEESGFFNAEELSDGSFDRVYVAEQFSNYFSLFVGNGVFINPADQLLVSSASESGSMKISVNEGWAFINGMWYHNKLPKELTVELNLESEPRADGVFCKYSKSDRKIETIVAAGRTTPVRNEQEYELLLAVVSVGTGVSKVTNADITDRRPDESVCGFVKGLVDVLETEALFQKFTATFNQFFENSGNDFNKWMVDQKAIFDEWFKGLQTDLEGDIAANLAGQISQLELNKQDKYNKYTIELDSTSWIEVEGQDTYIEIEIEEITGYEEVKVLPRNDWTKEQKTAWMNATILTGKTETGKLILYCSGKIPTLNLKVDILVGDSLNPKIDASQKGTVEVIGSAGGGGTGGGTLIYGKDLNNLANNSDEYAEFDGEVIQSQISNQGYKLFEKVINDLTLGKYSVIIRCKISNNSLDEEVLQINIRENDSNGTVIATRNIKSNMFSQANKYDSIGFTFNFNSVKGTKLYIVGQIIGKTQSVIISLDYISISSVFTSMSEM